MTDSLQREKTALSRDAFAGRLLGGSVRKSYAPVVDIDWDTPVADDKYFMPADKCTLYGTPLWESMTEAERIRLSREEFVNMLSMGIWFENLLNRLLLRDILKEDPTGRETHYSLTEMGDECRHMVMFGRAIDHMGARPYQLNTLGRRIVQAMPALIHGRMVWTAALVGEEIFDAHQRLILASDTADELQPIVTRLMRIHVTEEARHIQYARDGVRRTVGSTSKLRHFFDSNIHGLAALGFSYLLSNPAMYQRVGLDPVEARRQALANPHYVTLKHDGFRSLGEFLVETKFMGRFANKAWRKSGFWQ